MKAVIATLIFSILSAFVGVFSITQLCAKSNATNGSSDTMRERTTDAPPRQKIQQWVNH